MDAPISPRARRIIAAAKERGWTLWHIRQPELIKILKGDVDKFVSNKPGKEKPMTYYERLQNLWN